MLVHKGQGPQYDYLHLHYRAPRSSRWASIRSTPSAR
jgi:hypothetical protein